MSHRLFFVYLLVALSSACVGDDDGVSDVKRSIDMPYTVVFNHMTQQLVNEHYERDVCWNDWIQYHDSLHPDEQYIVALQSRYIDTFPTIADFGRATIAAYPQLDGMSHTARISLNWACWGFQQYRDRLVAQIEAIQAAGIDVWLTLSHANDYPAIMNHPSIIDGMVGWAHPDAASYFENYAYDVAATFKDTLPAGTVIVIANEPMSQLRNGFLGYETWPPGDTDNTAAFVQGLYQMREAFPTAANAMREHGWTPIIAHNIRPYEGQIGDVPAKTAVERMVYLENRWLVDAVLFDCQDNDFDGLHDVSGTPCDARDKRDAFSAIGITYYGGLGAAYEQWALPTDQGDVVVQDTWIDERMSPGGFYSAVHGVHTLYPDLRIHIAEIGFSSAFPEKMADMLRSYLNYLTSVDESAPGKLPVASVGIHALFRHGEFTAGEHTFNWMTRCANEYPCELTAGGSAQLDVLKWIAEEHKGE